jgi:hypothetical protein
MLNWLVNWFNGEFGDRAPMFAVITVFLFVLSAGVGFYYGRNIPLK